MHIISEITPLYIQYKAETNPTECIVDMWKVGQILNKHIKTTGLKPHTLFRDLYGKSETSVNTQQKSYIAREFQGRCYRVFNMFKSPEEIYSYLMGLKSVSAFREAMPFFDNEKYKMDRTTLYKLLTNAEKSNAEILNEIKQLQNSLIGKKNPRTQKLAEMDQEINCFKEFYQYILSFIKMKDFSKATEVFKQETQLTEVQIRELAKNTEQLTISDVQHSPILFTTTQQTTQNYIQNLEELLTSKNVKKLRRFRRLVNSKYVFLLTDMLNALLDKDSYLTLVGKLNG